MLLLSVCSSFFAAVFPGASRSGSTIVGSIAIGIKREAAAKFTFFLAIPVMLGASLLKILKYDGSVSGHEVGLLLVGMVTAFGVSLLVINRLMAFIRKHSFTVFGWYRIALGVIVLILGAAGVIGGGVLPGRSLIVQFLIEFSTSSRGMLYFQLFIGIF